VPPWVSICSGCKNKSFEKMLIENTSDEELDHITINAQVAQEPEKDCCDNKCKIAVCVPPFAFVCTACNEKEEPPKLPEVTFSTFTCYLLL
jgi:hypothetical protein